MKIKMKKRKSKNIRRILSEKEQSPAFQKSGMKNVYKQTKRKKGNHLAKMKREFR